MTPADGMADGRTRPDNRKPVSPGELRARYEAGESQASLVAATGLSYGRVRRLLESAGTEVRRTGSKQLRGAERQKVATEVRVRYEDGESVAELANSIGGCESRVRKLLRLAGVRPSPLDRRSGERARRATQARQLYESGQTLSYIATALGCHTRLVRSLIIEAGGIIGRKTRRPSHLEAQLQMLRAARHRVLVAGSAGSRSVALADAKRLLDAAVARAHDHGVTYAVIGKELGVSAERARQLARRHAQQAARRQAREAARRQANARTRH